MSDSGPFLLPPDVRALIDADRAASEPPAVVKDRLARRLEKALGLGALALGATLASTGTAAAASSAATTAAATAASAVSPPVAPVVGGVVWKWVAGASLSIAVGGGLVSLAHDSPKAHDVSQPGVSASAMMAQRPNSEPKTDIPSSAAASPVAAPSATFATERPRPLTSSRSPAAPPDRLAEERALLDGARRALVHRDTSGALQTIRLHERLFQQGQLVQERESMRIQALVLSRDYAGARAAGDRFRRRYPHSVLLVVVDKSLEGIP